MAGRTLCSEEVAIAQGFGGPEFAIRRRVLRETIAAFEYADPPDRYLRLALGNLERWRSERPPSAGVLRVGSVVGTRALPRGSGASLSPWLADGRQSRRSLAQAWCPSAMVFPDEP